MHRAQQAYCSKACFEIFLYFLIFKAFVVQFINYSIFKCSTWVYLTRDFPLSKLLNKFLPNTFFTIISSPIFQIPATTAFLFKLLPFLFSLVFYTTHIPFTLFSPKMHLNIFLIHISSQFDISLLRAYVLKAIITVSLITVFYTTTLSFLNTFLLLNYFNLSVNER